MREMLITAAWLCSGGHCECRRDRHGHDRRCGRTLVWAHRGLAPRFGAWQAREIGPHRYEILCWECYLHIEAPCGLVPARAA